MLLLGTGCRIGEAIGLRWNDVDMDKRMISINHSLTYYQGEKTLLFVSFGFQNLRPKCRNSHNSDDGTSISDIETGI